jgi:hypothetical protein
MKKLLTLFGAIVFWVNGFGPGSIQWQNTIGGSSTDELYSIQQTTDGGYILGGTSYSNISGDKTENSIGNGDYWMVKTDSLGNIQWQNTIGGNLIDRLLSMQQTSDGGYILGGYSNSNISGDKTENTNGYLDYWVVKTDSIGGIQWQNSIGGADNADALWSIQQTNDGGYILGGKSTSNISGDKTENCIGFEDYWLVKTDASGNIEWQNTIGGSNWDQLVSIYQTVDGGYILGGYSKSNISGDKTENCIGDYDYWLVKTDPLGNIQWQNTIGGNYDDMLLSVQQTTDGGFILGGCSGSNISGDKTENSWGSWDYWIVKTDATGIIQWQKTIGGNYLDELFSFEQTTDGGYILGGFSDSDISGDKTENGIGLEDYWLIKLSPDVGIEETNPISSIFLSPNPATDELVVQSGELKVERVEIYDVVGKRFALPLNPRQLTGTSASVTVDVSSLASGIYFVKVLSQKGTAAAKFVKQ